MRILCSIGILILVLGVFSPAFSNPSQHTGAQEVRVQAAGDIVEGRRDIARMKAIENAMRDAVAKGLGTLLSSRTLVEEGQLIFDTITREAEGFVASYEVVDERVDEAHQLYWITIVARVMTGKMESSIRQMMQQVGTVRTLVSIDGVDLFRFGVVQELIQSGVEVMDERRLEQAIDRQTVAMAHENPQLAYRAALWTWSRYIVRGYAYSESSEFRYGNTIGRSVSLHVMLEVSDFTSERILGTYAERFQSIGGTDTAALRTCVDQALTAISGVVAKWILDTYEWSERVDLVARQVTDLPNILSAIPGVESPELIEVKGTEQRFQIQYQGDIQTLAHRLSEFGLEVVRYDSLLFLEPKAAEPPPSAHIQVEIHRAQFQHVRLIRDTFGVIPGFSDQTLRFSLEGDPFDIAMALSEIDIEIVRMEEAIIVGRFE